MSEKRTADEMEPGKQVGNNSDADNIASDGNPESDDSDDSDQSHQAGAELDRYLEGEIETEADDAPDQWGWDRADNVPTIYPFTGSPGVTEFAKNRLGEKPSVLKVFYEFFGPDFWEMIATETNRYANVRTKEEVNKKAKIVTKWSDTTADEIKAYFSLCIIMSQVKKTSIQLNWAKRKIIETPVFGKTMTYSRFILISRFLHFVDESLETTDQLYNIRSIIEYFNARFPYLYSPEENILIEESVVKVRDRLSYSQFVPANKDRIGIKVFKLTESKSRYCTEFKVNLVIDKISSSDVTPDIVVADLTKTLLDKGHTLFLDYWYSSPQLFLNLMSKQTNVMGYARASRENMPKNIWFARLEEGEHESRSFSGLLAFKYKESKEICMLSSKHSNINLVEVGKKEKVLKPAAAVEYEKAVGDVELPDQFLTCFPIMRKFMKGYRKIFFYMTDLALYNAYLIHYKYPGSKKMLHGNFLLDVAESLLETAKLPEIKAPGRPAHGDTLSRLQAKSWGHFPRHILPTGKKTNPTRTCKVCAKAKKRSETSWECKQCLVSLHVPDCFEKYHTLQDY